MVTYAYEELFHQDSLPKNIIITYDNVTLTNSDIVSESLELTETLCPDENITLGSCNASQIKFRIGYIAQSLIGKTITVSIQPQGGDVFQIGVYKIDSDTRTADRRYKDIVAYDVMKDILEADVTDWYNGLFSTPSTTYTLKQFRDSFFTHVGVTQETTTLINDTLTVLKTIDLEVLSGKDVITRICEINGCFGHIGRDGNFHYIYLSNISPTPYPTENLNQSDETVYPVGENGTYIRSDYEDYETALITKLQIRNNEDDIGKIVGSGTNCYVIQDNFLAYGLTDTELTNIATPILTKLADIQYIPMSIETKGNPCFEVGDGIEFVTTYDTVYSYIFQRTLKGIQALFDTYESSGTQTLETNINSVHQQIIQIKGRTNELKRNIDETVSELSRYETTTDGTLTSYDSRITQNASSISAEISRAQGAENTLSNTITATAGELTVRIEEIYAELDGEIAVYYREGEPTLLNYPAWDFTYNIPCNNTVQTSDNLKFIYTDEYYQENIRDLVYDTNSNLTYRFEKEDGAFYWKPIADTDFSVAMQKISELEVTTDNISATVSATTTELHSNYYTKNETEGKISVSASGVLSYVSQNYTNSSDLAANYTKQSTFNQTVDGINASVSAEVTARQNGDSTVLSTARSEISASASEVTAKVESGDKVWDTRLNGTAVTVSGVFYNPSSSVEPSPFNLNKYYLNQQTGTLWWRNANNKYSRQCSVLYNSASSAVTMQKDSIELKVSTDELETKIQAIPGGLTLSTGQLIVNSDYFTLDAQGKGTLGGLTFDQNGFYSQYEGSKILRVHPSAASGFALSVGENNVTRMFYEDRESGFQIRYENNQYSYSTGHEGEVYVTKLQVKDEYTKSGSTYTKTDYGQLHVDDYISCWGNIEIGLENGGGSGIPINGGSLYSRHHRRDTSGTTGNVIAENYIGATGANGGSGDIEAHHDLIYGHACYQSSDERLKKDIEELTDSEDFIYSLKPVKYKYINDDKEEHHGFIAQDIEEITPTDSAIIGENRDGFKMVAYTEIIADLVKTVQLQNERIKALERST